MSRTRQVGSYAGGAAPQTTLYAGRATTLMDEVTPVRIIIIETQSEALVSRLLREMGSPNDSRKVFIEKVEMTGDTYNVSGQAGAVGPDASSHGDSFQQVVWRIDGVNPSRLADELEAVRVAMKRIAGSDPTPEQDDEIGKVAGAQIAARKSDSAGVISYLKSVGTWTMTVVKETGAEIVALTLAHIIGG